MRAKKSTGGRSIRRKRKQGIHPSRYHLGVGGAMRFVGVALGGPGAVWAGPGQGEVEGRASGGAGRGGDELHGRSLWWAWLQMGVGGALGGVGPGAMWTEGALGGSGAAWAWPGRCGRGLPGAGPRACAPRSPGTLKEWHFLKVQPRGPPGRRRLLHHLGARLC